MFEQTRARAAVAKFIHTNQCSSGQCLPLFEEVLPQFMPYVTRQGFDANQSAVAIITGTINELNRDRKLWAAMKANNPVLYSELGILWSYCEFLLNSDRYRWELAFNGDLNPFTGGGVVQSP